jgi:hypothetical protein
MGPNGISRGSAPSLSLIDFGLASKFIKAKQHVAPSSSDFFRGNILFASQAALHCRAQSRKDDIESLFYLVAFIMN